MRRMNGTAAVYLVKDSIVDELGSTSNPANVDGSVLALVWGLELLLNDLRPNLHSLAGELGAVS